MTTTTIATAYLVGCLSAIAAIDIRDMRIPDPLTLALLIGGLTWTALERPYSMSWAITSVAVTFAVLWAIRSLYTQTRRRIGLGLGDVKLCGAAATWIGLEGMPTMLLYASVAGLLTVGLYRLAGYHAARDTRIPFGPFLVGALLLVWLFGPLHAPQIS